MASKLFPGSPYGGPGLISHPCVSLTTLWFFLIFAYHLSPSLACQLHQSVAQAGFFVHSFVCNVCLVVLFEELGGGLGLSSGQCVS
jgi:hypothetical protein